MSPRASSKSSAPSPRPRLVLATRNANKAREIGAIYGHLGLDLRTLAEWPEIEQLPEEGATYAENAAAKARAVASATGLPALADDSGIEIDALGGEPGPRSRRFLGNDATDADRDARVLELLRHEPAARRGARYRAAVALALPDGSVWVFEGTCEGTIALAPRGHFGFGYDPIFVVAGHRQTMAELPPERKNQISHRARALRAAEPCVCAVLRPARKEPLRTDANTGDAGSEPSAAGRPRVRRRPG